MNIVFLFPTNYKHGQSSNFFYRDIVSILSVHPHTQDFLNDIFTKTNIYRKFKALSFQPYIEWNMKEKNTYVALPKIHIWYKDNKLSYFNLPTYFDLKFDFYLLTSEKNTLSNEKTPIITETLVGKYILSLD